MLFFVGLGLNGLNLSKDELDAVNRADAIFLDQVTNYISDSDLAAIKKNLKGVTILERSDLEERMDRLINMAKNKNVVILVPGDPLIATTHHILLDAAAKSNVKYKTFHAASIFSAAIGESNLDIYKFGPPTTVTFWSEKYKPVSFIDVIKKNLENDEHSLILLDYDYKNKRRMNLGEALELLISANREKKYKIIGKSTKILIMGDIGKDTMQITYVALGRISGKLLKSFENKTITLILPGKLNFAEEAALSKFSKQGSSI